MEVIKTYLDTNKEIVIECFEKIFAINRYCSENLGKQGGGLSAGILVDLVINEYFVQKLENFKSFHSGESDCILMDHNFSIKKITGKSNIALDWSKNKNQESQKEYFISDMMIFNLKSQKWLKTSKFIPSGLYFIPNDFCKQNIQLKQNNKTNSLIDSKNLYKMLEYSLENNLCIQISESQNKFEWCVLNGFSIKQT
jgi:hypothetical protein